MNTVPFLPVLRAMHIEHRMVQRHEDQRAAPRFVCTGNVQMDLPGGGALRGVLMDVSSDGFRLQLGDSCPAIGTDVKFSHQFFQGRARMVWAKPVDLHFEAGFTVLRD